MAPVFALVLYRYLKHAMICSRLGTHRPYSVEEKHRVRVVVPKVMTLFPSGSSPAS